MTSYIEKHPDGVWPPAPRISEEENAPEPYVTSEPGKLERMLGALGLDKAAEILRYIRIGMANYPSERDFYRKNNFIDYSMIFAYLPIALLGLERFKGRHDIISITANIFGIGSLTTLAMFGVDTGLRQIASLTQFHHRGKFLSQNTP